MKTKKALLTLMCVVLLVAGSIFGTYAYLADIDAAVNTFTVGKVEITLDEADVDDSDKDQDTTDRDTANAYKLIPGETYVKDPTVHVAEGSEDAWLFVKVENGIANYESETRAKSIEGQIEANGWTLVSEQTEVYAYQETVSAGDDVVVFEKFEIRPDANSVAGWSSIKTDNKQIIVTAYAIQAAGFDTAEEAWAAAPAAWSK